MMTPHEGKPGRKQRVPLACEQCRSRKLKCNREKPCQNCIVRNKAGQCFFKGTEDGTPAAQKVRAEDMKDRINRLETLVTTLIAQKQGSAEPNIGGGPTDQLTPPAESMAQSSGTIDVDESRSIYRGTTHWSDVLEELQEMKSLWGQFQGHSDMITGGAPASNVGFDGPSLLGGGVIKPATREELLATMPSKPAADKLIERFFDEEDSPVPTFHILHQPSFMKEYEAHWKDTSATSVMWLGQLFAMLSLTMMSYTLSDDEPPEYEGISSSLTELYRLRTAQCLVMADVTKYAPYTLETMIFNTMAEWALQRNGATRVWMMVGLMTRVAIQMGYHRDPSHYPELSIFQGELRRRVWSFIYRLDSLTSFLVGLPSMVNPLDTDSTDPRNIHDWELYEEMTVMPPSRPNTDITPMTYLLAKGTMIAILSGISGFLNSLGNRSYDRVLEIDKEFTQAYHSLPPYYKVGDIEELRVISTALSNRRVQLVFLYHQGICVLHRKFLAQGRMEPRFALSYQRCIDSATILLQLQNFLFTDNHEKGTKVAKHWYRVSYMTQEYILAAMILCLDLKHRRKKSAEEDPLPSKQETEILDLLKTACNIWSDSRGTSPDAEKVYRVLSSMLGTLDSGGTVGDSATLAPVLPSFEDSFAVTGLQSEVDYASMDFDWDVWDTFIEGASFEETYVGVLT